MHKRIPLEKRFWSHVDKSGDCWIWTGAKNRDGYGRFNFNVRILNASRACWLIVHGDIPEGMNVLHRCDNPACVNPDHLFLGTRQDNTLDMIAKGRWGGPKGATHPFKLHPELASHGKNHRHAKLDDDKVRQIRALRQQGMRFIRIARQFGVEISCIAAIVYGKTWKHVK